MSFFPLAVQASINMLTTYSPIFQQTGMAVFRIFAVITLILEGWMVASNQKSGNSLASSVMMIAIVYSGLTYWQSPVPGVGRSIPGIISDASVGLSSVIDTATADSVGQSLSDAIGSQAGGTWSIILNQPALIRFFVLEFILAGMQVALLSVITFGIWVLAIFVLTGPLFITTLIIPGFDFLFWHWVGGLLKYAAYPLVATAVTFLYAQVWQQLLTQFQFPLDSQVIAAGVMTFVSMGITSIWLVFKVPAIAGELFGGGSIQSGFVAFRQVLPRYHK